MIELNERAEQFLESIREEGKSECDAIRADTDARINEALDEVRRAEQAKAEETVRVERKRAEEDAHRALAQLRNETHAKLYTRRCEAQQHIFARTREKLVEFVASGEYPAWLQQRADRLIETLHLGKGAVLYLRPADTGLLHLPAGITVKADDSIQIGGIKAEDKNAGIAADDTIESSLGSLNEWFQENGYRYFDF